MVYEMNVNEYADPNLQFSLILLHQSNVGYCRNKDGTHDIDIHDIDILASDGMA